MDFYEIVKSRRSTRKFLNKPVAREKLERIIECARYAPMKRNLQPLKYYGVLDAKKVSELYHLCVFAGW